jgi:thioredoxin-like negative regulator of GroEL
MSLAPDEGLRVLFVTRRSSGVGRRMESVLATLQTRTRNGVRVYTIDADADSDLVERLGVRQVPALVFMKDRQSVAQICGRATLDEIKSVLAALSAE